MAAGIATATANSFLDALCRSVTWTAPAAFWAKLHTGNPGAAGATNAAAETTRKQATFGTAADLGRIKNTAPLSWTAVSNTENYAYISWWDANVAGNFLGSSQLMYTRSMTAGEDFTIATGEIQFFVETTVYNYPQSLSEATANAFLDSLCRATTWSEPAEFWVKLHFGLTDENATAWPAVNTTRQQATFSAAAGGAITTSADLVWAAVPATEPYRSLSFWSAAAAGTLLGTCKLNPEVSITAGQTFTIAAGDLDISIPVAS